jgi:hypothetical protein
MSQSNGAYRHEDFGHEESGYHQAPQEARERQQDYRPPAPQEQRPPQSEYQAPQPEYRAPVPAPQHVSSAEPSRADEAPAEHVAPKPRAQFEPSPPAAPSPGAASAAGGGESSGAKPFVVWSSAPSSGSRDRGRED